MCNFGRRHREEQFCEIILNLDQCFRCRLKIFLICSSGAQWFRRFLLKIFLIWSSGSPFVQRSRLCNFGRGHFEEQFCDFFFNLGHSLKRFLTWSSGGPPVQWSGTIYAILKEDIMGNILVKLVKFGPVFQEDMLFKEKVYGRRTDKDQSQYLTLSLRLQ